MKTYQSWRDEYYDVIGLFDFDEHHRPLVPIWLPILMLLAFFILVICWP